jgi:cytochrome c5
MKTVTKLALAFWLIATFNAFAQESAPDVGVGKKRAAVCFACHGADGISKIPGVPHLAGQQREYLEKALQAYRGAQTRQDPAMTAMAKPLTDKDITNIAAYFSLQARMSDGKTMAQLLETTERVKPVAVVAVEKPSNEPASNKMVRNGETVIQSSCAACHSSGVAGAPKFGDKAAWSARVAQGKEVLYTHALQGFKMMPAKGGCASCTDEEIKGAVDYIVEKIN